MLGMYINRLECDLGVVIIKLNMTVCIRFGGQVRINLTRCIFVCIIRVTIPKGSLIQCVHSHNWEVCWYTGIFCIFYMANGSV